MGLVLDAVCCRGAKATSLATKVAEQLGGGGSGMSLRHASTAGAERLSEAAEPSAHPPPRAPPRVHRPVVRESDMRKFAGQVNFVTFLHCLSRQLCELFRGTPATHFAVIKFVVMTMPSPVIC